MADITSITLPSGSKYNFKDGQAVTNITNNNGVFVATKRDGSTFNFSQQQYNTQTASIGSASGWSAGSLPSLGTAIPADDITKWTTNTPTQVAKKTVVTTASFNTMVKTVTNATASISNGVLTITNGSHTTGAAGSATTGDSVTVTPGTAATLEYTAKTIPNITSTGTLPTLTITNKTVLTSITPS